MLGVSAASVRTEKSTWYEYDAARANFFPENMMPLDYTEFDHWQLATLHREHGRGESKWY